MTDGAPKVPSQAMVLVFGGLTAALLLVVLMAGLRSSLRAQLSGSGHRVDEVALGVAQSVRMPLRASANAMTFIAEESRRLQSAAPQQSDAILKGLIVEVLRRQPQIRNIAFLDAARPGGGSTVPAPERDAWAPCDASMPPAAGTPCFGPVAKTPQGALLALAMPVGMQRWLTGYVRVDALKHAVANVPHADDVSFEVVDAHGRAIVQGDSPGIEAVGQREPIEPWWIRKLFALHASIPLRATAAVDSYPFKVVAGMTYEKALAPWRRQVAMAAAFYLFYLSAFVCLLGVMYRATKVQHYYIRSLQARTQELHTAQHVGQTAIWTFQARRFECGDEAEEMFGLPRGKSAASVREFLAQVLPSDRWLLIDQIRRAWESGEPLHSEFCIRKPDGTVRRLSAGGQVVAGEAGTKRMIGIVVDVTEQWEARRHQAESEHRFRSLFEQNPLPFWVFDASTLRFLEVNDAAVKAYGYTRDEFLGMSILDIRPPADRPRVVAHLSSSRETRQSPKVWAHRTKEGKTMDVRIHGADIVFNGRPARLVLAEDITSYLAGERELEYRASHDLVTRLPNRHTLIEWMDTLIVNGAAFDVAYLQLLGMDAIADTFGIHVGTEIFQAMSARIAPLTGSNEFLATVNHEAFAWVAPSGQLAYERLEAITQCVTEPLHYKDTQHQIEMVIGVANHPRDGTQGDAILASAALAAHAHLRSDQSIHYFEPSLAQKSKEKLHLAARLRKAVKRHEFEVHFQPITNFSDRRLAGLEALIRWPQEDGTLISPSIFIPLCEESGLIVPLGRWVLNQAAKASRELKEAGFDRLPIGVNISPAELWGSDLVASLRAAREAYSVADNAINIELTESSLLEHEDKAIAVMRQLRSDGVAIALDDFGTGFSSLSYLRNLPIDILKIDQAFVRSVDKDARSATICDAIIALGKRLKVRVVAEGVERASQYRWLYLHGCDGAQGFYLSRPERLSELLARWTPAREKAQ